MQCKYRVCFLLRGSRYINVSSIVTRKAAPSLHLHDSTPRACSVALKVIAPKWQICAPPDTLFSVSGIGLLPSERITVRNFAALEGCVACEEHGCRSAITTSLLSARSRTCDGLQNLFGSGAVWHSSLSHWNTHKSQYLVSWTGTSKILHLLL